MSLKKLTVPVGTFSSDLSEELRSRLEIGVVEFTYVYTTTTDTHRQGQVRHAVGTRNLSMSFIPFSDVPYGGRTVKPYELTYFDLDRGAWRECITVAVLSVSEDIFVEI